MAQSRYLLVIIGLFLMFSPKLNGSRYDFLLFENFEYTRMLFIGEQETIRELQLNRRYLYQKMDYLNDRIYNNPVTPHRLGTELSKTQLAMLDNSLGFQLKMVSDCLNSSRLSTFVISNQKYNDFKTWYNYDFSFGHLAGTFVSTIMESAIKGLVMLQETYDQDITNFSRGHLHLKSGVDRNTRRMDSLQVDDLASMSTMAFNHYKWYDTGIRYLKTAIGLFESLSLEERKELPSNLEESLLLMKKQYPAYHNGLLNKKKNIIGPGWKLSPYLIDTGE